MKKQTLRFIGRWVFWIIVYGLVWLLTLFQGDKASWFLTYFITFILLLLLIVSISPLRNWRIQYALAQPYYAAGETIHVHLQLHRKIPFLQGNLKIQQQIRSKTDASGWLEQTISPFFRKKLLVPLPGFPAKRGPVDFSTVRLTTRDPFNLIAKSIQLETTETLLVYPAYEKALALSIADSLSQGEQNADHWSLMKNENIHGLRKFQNGDRIALIDWKTTAKKNELFMKEYESSRNAELHVFFHNKHAVDHETSLTACYSFVRHLSEQGQPIELLIPTETFQQAGEGKAFTETIAHLFANLEAKPADQDLLIPDGPTIVFTPEIDETIQRVLENYRYHDSLKIVTAQGDPTLHSDKVLELADLIRKEARNV
ncbi:DUF58 domain-containing protein [Listeria grayi]|uniref:DUF58 domain-containing protein n=1 Tax=Listeria grayi TaxID=1641 RepID=UPI0016274E2E|nr:DUF58 domain-containing protein [Listeria grayi]MBC1922763.1 DUF58 domain-containing protein [Listeria grayi]